MNISRARLKAVRMGVLALLVGVGLALGIPELSGGKAGGSAVASAARPGPTGLHRGVKRPNIVFVLTDDLSMDLLRYMPQVQALRSRGLTFRNYFVTDSLCCPSRSSIFTGDFPHDTHVFSNTGRDGGIRAFYSHRDEWATFNLALQRAGYRTAMMGKYLNGYMQGPTRSPVPDTYVPPGWNEWDVAGFAYSEYDYRLNQNGRLNYYGDAPRDYLTSVLARQGVQFIDRTAGRHPFFLEMATFTPHFPYTPAPQDVGKFAGLAAPEPPSFDRLPANPPHWLSGHQPLTADQLRSIDSAFQLRVEDVQSIDRMISGLEGALARHHQLKNTYIVFSSDNGLHMGEYRLMPGKLTAFDTDIHVPLVIAGPGIRPGTSTRAMTENIDLAKTFEGIAGTSRPCDGHSLLPLFKGGLPRHWRDAVLVEHHGPARSSLDPDKQNSTSGNPTTYAAMRTPQFLYVEYKDGEREFYDLKQDPYELDNLAGELPVDQLAGLHLELGRLKHCHGGKRCWAAEHVPLKP